MERLKIYLDNCCYNRPYDDQSQFLLPKMPLTDLSPKGTIFRIL